MGAVRSLGMRRRIDPKDLPAYSLPDTAGYLGLSASTLRSWVTGRCLIEPALGDPLTLSFNNLVEAHVLGAMRFEHGFSWREVFLALGCVQTRLATERPLLKKQFETDGVSLFVEHLGSLVNVSKDGQLAWRRVLHSALQRIDRDPKGIPVRLFPFVAQGELAKPVTIDPRMAFGRPTVSGTGISTAMIVARFRGGEPIAELADDYGVRVDQIQAALRYEGEDAAA